MSSLQNAEPNALCPAYSSLRSYGEKQKQRQVVFFGGTKTEYTEESKLLLGKDTLKAIRTDWCSSVWKGQIWAVMAGVFGDFLWWAMILFHRAHQVKLKQRCALTGNGVAPPPGVCQNCLSSSYTGFTHFILLCFVVFVCLFVLGVEGLGLFGCGVFDSLFCFLVSWFLFVCFVADATYLKKTKQSL